MNNRLPTIEELLKFMIDSGLELFSKSDNNLVVKNEDLTIRATFYDGTYEGTIDFSVKKKNGGHSLQERLTSFVSIKEIVNIILNETNPEIKFYSIANDIKNIGYKDICIRYCMANFSLKKIQIYLYLSNFNQHYFLTCNIKEPNRNEIGVSMSIQDDSRISLLMEKLKIGHQCKSFDTVLFNDI